MQTTSSRWIAGGLIGMAVSLLSVGVLSGTPIRHAIQISPVVLALVVVALKRSWASYAALPVCIFWLVIMLLIWLWLTGIAAITTGTFTVAEVILTLFIGASCVSGMLGWYRTPSPGKPLIKAGVFGRSESA